MQAEKFTYIKQFEEEMLQKLPLAVKAYVRDGADDEITLKRNVQDFEK